jgi:SAM-dependent methyltransferase
LYPNWELNFFRDVACDMWRLAMTPAQTQAEVEFLQKTLAASNLLDVPCGNGRHSIELAKAGARVTGVDSSVEFLAEAQHASHNLDARWIQADMCDLPWSAEFDGAFCMGNSFGYLNPARAQQFLQAVSRSLKTGSRFVLETGMAAESILPGLQPSRWFKIGDIYMLSRNQYHPREARLDIEYTFIRNGKEEIRPSSSYVLTVNEICRMIQQVGLEPQQLLASVAGEPYQLGAQRLLLVAGKSHQTALSPNNR